MCTIVGNTKSLHSRKKIAKNNIIGKHARFTVIQKSYMSPISILEATS